MPTCNLNNTSGVLFGGVSSVLFWPWLTLCENLVLTWKTTLSGKVTPSCPRHTSFPETHFHHSTIQGLIKIETRFSRTPKKYNRCISFSETDLKKTCHDAMTRYDFRCQLLVNPQSELQALRRLETNIDRPKRRAQGWNLQLKWNQHVRRRQMVKNSMWSWNWRLFVYLFMTHDMFSIHLQRL